jgi:hypothetical protein
MFKAQFLAALRISELPERWKARTYKAMEKNGSGCGNCACDKPAEFLLVLEIPDRSGGCSFATCLGCPEHAEIYMRPKDKPCRTEHSPCPTDRVN